VVVKIAPSIVVDPTLYSGKPVIQGTQVLVEEVIAKLAAGVSVETLTETYQITAADIQAALGYAAKKLSLSEMETLLEESTRAGDYQQFVSLVEAIDWATHPPHVLAKAIDLALSLEMTRLAARLAELGGRLFPDDDRLCQAAKVLAAPAMVRKSVLPSIKGKEASMDWLKAHASQYRGQWVAVRKGVLLESAGSLADLMTVVDGNDDPISTIITRVL